MENPIKKLLSLLPSPWGKWPKRKVRPLVRIELASDTDEPTIGLNHILRQHGYTGGDRCVVLLESDFARIAHIAHQKTAKAPESPMEMLLRYDRVKPKRRSLKILSME